MLSVLSAVETKTMVYLIDRTLGWMKDRETVSYREFKEGGKGESFGAGIDKDTAAKCIRSLAEKGIIFIVKTTKKMGTLIALNLKWKIEDMLREPKQGKKKPKTEKLSSSSVPREHTPCPTRADTSDPSNGTPLERNIKNYTERTTSTNRAGRHSLKPVANSTVEEAIAAGKEKHKSAAAGKRAKMSSAAKGGYVSGEALETYWVDGIKAADPSAVFKAWTGKERGQSKHIMNLTSIPKGKLLDFMYFCAYEWSTIIRSQFPWAKSETASMPNIGFVLKYLNQFASAYNNRDKIAKREKTMTMKERRIARLMDEGYSEAEAIEEIEQTVEKNQRRRVRRQPQRKAKPIDHLKAFQDGSHPARKRTRTEPEQVEEVKKDKPVIREIDEIELDLDLGELRSWEEIHGDK